LEKETGAVERLMVMCEEDDFLKEIRKESVEKGYEVEELTSL
jgi:hypothetical protein